MREAIGLKKGETRARKNNKTKSNAEEKTSMPIMRDF